MYLLYEIHPHIEQNISVAKAESKEFERLRRAKRSHGTRQAPGKPYFFWPQISQLNPSELIQITVSCMGSPPLNPAHPHRYERREAMEHAKHLVSRIFSDIKFLS